jgi:hypothetical protein
MQLSPLKITRKNSKHHRVLLAARTRRPAALAAKAALEEIFEQMAKDQVNTKVNEHIMRRLSRQT